LEQEISGLDRQVERAAHAHAVAVRLMTHPGVGPVTALAVVLSVGPARQYHHPNPGLSRVNKRHLSLSHKRVLPQCDS
jgi:transposase